MVSLEELKSNPPANLIALSPHEIPLTQRTFEDEGEQLSDGSFVLGGGSFKSIENTSMSQVSSN